MHSKNINFNMISKINIKYNLKIIYGNKCQSQYLILFNILFYQ